MADKIVQLIDGRNNDNIFPVSAIGDIPVITVTSTDPGEGSSLAENHFVAVVGSGTASVGASDLAINSVTTAKIADQAVTSDKINYDTIPVHKDFLTSVAITTTETSLFTYTIPVSGWYFISVCASLHAPGSSHSTYITIKNNGNTIDTGYQTNGASEWGNETLQNFYQLTAGDVITVWFRDTVGISASTNTKLRFMAVRI